MKHFAALYRELDATTSSAAKQLALQHYLRTAGASHPEDAAWAVYFLAGGKPRQLVPTRLLRELAQDAAGLPEWLFEESYQAVGDLAETVSLLLPAPTQPTERGLAQWLAEQLLPLRSLKDPEALRHALKRHWSELPESQRLVYFKLLTGGFRVGVSRLQVTQALAAVAGVDAKRIAQRLMGYTHIGALPTAASYQALIAPESDHERQQQGGQPYPFFLAHPLNPAVQELPALLGHPHDWLAEWKWDGIRAQLVKRAGQVWLWSRGEELITERFPELQAMGAALPDGTVLDGEVLVWRDGRAQPFADLQQRIGRKTLGARLLRDIPVVLMAYDLLEWAGQDQRTAPQHARRAQLQEVVQGLAHPQLLLSPVLEVPTAVPEGGLQGDAQEEAQEGAQEGWASLAAQRESARTLGVEGLMLKQRSAQYGVGRTRDVGLWWKWKLDPFSVDAVLVYAQRGHGRRASLYSDYTFAVWNAPPGDTARQLVPFAKAYSGLTDAEMARVDAIIKKTTQESFGPVRSVRPTLVFELGFEGIARSTRHKCGIAVRFPRMLRWREDKPVEEADTLQSLQALLPGGAA